jgi:phytoene dehydrogenase-like protein
VNPSLDAIVVGAGPNGLTAAITLARAGLRVRVYEAGAAAGGGARTEELTLPGFRHDPCSAVYPLGVGSPVLRALPLADHGLHWIHPDLALAHPFPDGSAATLSRSMAETARSLGEDGTSYLRLLRPFQHRWSALAADLLRPPLAGWPRHPALLARFGVHAGQPLAVLARRFRGEHARGLFAGLAAHAMAPLSAPATGGAALLFALAAHEVGWPFPRGGAQALSDALASYLRSLGGQIETGHLVRDLAELPPARAYLLDTAPGALAAIAGDRLPGRYARRLLHYQHGPAAFKIDYALSGPVPWTAAACRRAGTVHIGPSYAEIGGALRSIQNGGVPRPPFLIIAQPSLFDPSRAPAGSHVLWVYAHVSNAWPGDLTAAVEARIERFAPGFADLVLARTVTRPADLAARNPNDVGGDIGNGRGEGLRLLFRPTRSPVPYATPNPAIYLCSAATPPGPGVHGMCGHHAALTVLRRVFQPARETVADHGA